MSPAWRNFEYHDARKALSPEDRNNAIRQGYGDFQFFGWQKDPPYPERDPRRWYWQNGAEMAEQIRTTGRGAREDVDGWT